ncbi:hypothetical protein CMV_018445 [Castanea mollissima]|uniref:Uncharacterized protein n=1 Tax=Castanea mollissima TaxID=60419 RepID=A0A8J4QRJ5_9ROSI|nr:hypothetical protein CMV_018445 [Castanea mollissima]
MVRSCSFLVLNIKSTFHQTRQFQISNVTGNTEAQRVLSRERNESLAVPNQSQSSPASHSQIMIGWNYGPFSRIIFYF